jgi:hypothetical protein
MDAIAMKGNVHRMGLVESDSNVAGLIKAAQWPIEA